MIAKFDTTGAGGGGSTESKGGNGLIYFAVAVVSGYLLWTYVIKPEMDKRKVKAEEKQ